MAKKTQLNRKSPVRKEEKERKRQDKELEKLLKPARKEDRLRKTRQENQ
jgi:hypothetical protein